MKISSQSFGGQKYQDQGTNIQALFQVSDCPLPPASSYGKRGQGALWDVFIRALTPIMRWRPDDLIISQRLKALTSKAITLGIKISTHESGQMYSDQTNFCHTSTNPVLKHDLCILAVYIFLSLSHQTVELLKNMDHVLVIRESSESKTGTGT